MGIRSMFSGVSGLQSHSTWIDVIGNNISNTNTVAYKASRVQFSDQISQTQFSGTGPNAGSNLGGVNPQQVGLGTRVASIQTLFNAGPTLQTGNSTDIALVGDGFLVAKSGSATLLTRAGNLSFDGDGNLVDQNGGLIQGFNGHVEFNQKAIHSVNGNGAVPPTLTVTQAEFVVDNTNISQVTNIQIKRDFVLPPRATTVAVFSGNLDSFQQANQPGGILDLNPGLAAPRLPFISVPLGLNPAKAQYVAIAPATGQQIQQLLNFGDPIVAAQVPEDPNLIAAGRTNTTLNVTTPIMAAGMILTQAQAVVTNAWEQQPPIPPAHVSASTVYDSLGNPRSVTVQYYQVNDLGTSVPPVNPSPMNQVLYAWYAFDTTGGAPVSNATLVGGTGIIEGDPVLGGYDRGIAGNVYWGDFVWFNTDGSLASTGGTGGPIAQMWRPHVYLPPIQPAIGPVPVSPIPTIGAEITDVTLDFGTAGILGATGGRRDGLYSDAEGQFQVVNGVNTYVPSHTAYIKEQDGYRDGQLLGVQFDKTGTIIGSFSNDQHVALGQVVLAMPNNQGGLNKVGGNYYTPSANAGPMFVGIAGQLGLGTIQGNALEGSNVDLTIELTNMIIAQRGFEVNAKVITTSDEMMQTITQLKR
jgi:flagellar hook protein FlgE